MRIQMNEKVLVTGCGPDPVPAGEVIEANDEEGAGLIQIGYAKDAEGQDVTWPKTAEQVAAANADAEQAAAAERKAVTKQTKPDTK